MTTEVNGVCDIKIFATWLELNTQASHIALQERLQRWSDVALQHQSNKLASLKVALQRDATFFKEANDIFKEIEAIETRLNALLDSDSKLEEESYNEILFFNKYLQSLNFIPFVLSIWSFIRIYALPGISLLLPLLTLVAPYFIIKFVFDMPITFNTYMNILQCMISGNLQNMSNADTPFVPSNVPPLAALKQFGIMAMTFIQGILQPYWTYKHLKSIDNIIYENGTLIRRFHTLYGALSDLLHKHGFTFYRCPLPVTHGERDAVAHVLLNAPYYKMALKYIGSIEVLIKLAANKDIHPVKWVTSTHPVFNIKDTYDYQVPMKTRRLLSCSLDEKRHVLLTGPNKGGKSTVLRALSMSALLAHTYGAALGHLVATPFSTMFTCLTPDDLPGCKSRFEREIEYTTNTLISKGRALIFIDELYSSTNPPDALRSSSIYCERLWNRDNLVSVISTHLFELVENATERVQRLCCSARMENDTIEFEYELKSGICKVSSVDMLLKKYGLLINNALSGR
jgi:energy-coupling factor transporter ATP-binding protein EcfA2